jgi:four helix bundle protein
MSNLPYAKTFRALVAYQKARAVAREVYALSKGFPVEERFSLTDQVRRSSRSVGAQIAEAWAKRRYPRDFVSKLSNADGEQLETQHWLDSALDCGILTDPQVSSLIAELSEIGRMLNSMILKSDAFCQDDTRVIREDTSEYFVMTELPC